MHFHLVSHFVNKNANHREISLQILIHLNEKKIYESLQDTNIPQTANDIPPHCMDFTQLKCIA